MSRFLGRTFLLASARNNAFAAARNNAYATAASSDAVRKASNPLEELFEVERKTDDDKPVIYGTTTTANLTSFKKEITDNFSNKGLTDI